MRKYKSQKKLSEEYDPMKEINDKTIDQSLFMRLIKLGNHPYDGYSILNDFNFVQRIHADSDEDAIRQFREFLNNRKKSVNENYNYRGCSDIQLISHGEWADAELIYDGHSFDYEEVENKLWDAFCYDMGYEDTDETWNNEKIQTQFSKYVCRLGSYFLDEMINDEENLTEAITDSDKILFTSQPFNQLTSDELADEIEEFQAENGADYSDDEIIDILQDMYAEQAEEDLNQFIENVENISAENILYVSGTYARWDGGHNAFDVYTDIDKGIRKLVFPDYDSEALFVANKNGDVYFTEYSHDTPVGGSAMYLYTFRTQADADAAYNWLTQESNSFGLHDVDNNDINTLIKNGWLKPVNFKLNESCKKKSTTKGLTESVDDNDEPYLRIFLTNLGKYNEGELVGEWVDLPISDDDLEAVYERIQIGDEYEETFITDYETNLGIEVGEYDSIDDLNDIAESFQGLDKWDLQIYRAAVEAYGVDNVDVDNLDYTFFEDVSDDSELAERYIDELYGGVEQLDEDTLERYFDYEQFGRELQMDFYNEDADEENGEDPYDICSWLGISENSSDYDIGEEYVNMCGDLKSCLGNDISNYFDYDSFGRDLSFDGTYTSQGFIFDN